MCSVLMNQGGFYNVGQVTNTSIAPMVFLENGINFYTAFHEIAQLHVANKLFSIEKNQAQLEASVSNGTESGKVDVKIGNPICEVKSGLGAASLEDQLQKYMSIDYTLVKGGTLDTKVGVHDYSDWKMDITFPVPGHVRYFLYNQFDDDKKPICALRIS